MSNKKVALVVIVSLSFLVFAALYNMGIIDNHQYHAMFKHPLSYLLLIVALYGVIKNRKANT